MGVCEVPMLEAAIKERLDVAGGRRAALRAKTLARVLVLLACCLLLTACPPDGGDLVPLGSGDGASVVTTGFEGDTLVVTREGVTLRARGLWSVADAATSVILDASNANAEPAAIDFGRGELSRDADGGGRMTLRSVARASGAGGTTAFLPDKRAEIGGGVSATFVLEFKMDSGDGLSGVAGDLTGQTVTLRLPVEVRRGLTADFVFGFKYAERRLRR
ncbi:MAG: hypothetical protein QOH49_3118 [Acidobacteriota bacterium]|nr:hypothetical protein [Acidobacteriota bacterium]